MLLCYVAVPLLLLLCICHGSSLLCCAVLAQLLAVATHELLLMSMLWCPV
jgi:hypothetical protein